jgi:hypothetical protein
VVAAIDEDALEQRLRTVNGSTMQPTSMRMAARKRHFRTSGA